MAHLQQLLWALSFAELLKGLGTAFILGRLLGPLSARWSSSKRSWLYASFRVEIIKTAGFFFLFLAARIWLALVDRHVPEPYLDEVFHIPQAQTYCEGRFWDWDDKITTPPGLYLLSVAYHKLWMLPQCTPFSLRYNNLLATLLTALLAAQCRHLVEVRTAEREGKPVPRSVSWYSYHTGLNVALFPVIVFFSTLYYTDVVSTLVVLVAYRDHLLRLGTQRPSFLNDLWTVVLGVAALFMRQTNVFWVVVYMGGLEAVHALRSAKLPPQQYFTKLHDPPLDQSGPEDWLYCVLTLAVTALYNPVKVLRQIWPHITVLGLFAGFVAWNGGVVLGDKSNHIATIHLAQMLYIWPLFAFFSAPLLLPSFLAALTRPSQYFRSLLSLTSKRVAVTPVPYTLLTLLASVAIVKFNTIIHPFTLADNRHYMFYVFRYSILRSPTIRLSLVAAYTLSRWLIWDQLAGISHTTTQTKITTGSQQKQAPTPTHTTTNNNRNNSSLSESEPCSSSQPPPTSTALLYLLTTALSLITAPLVEPRYFILPWVLYRLLVPSWFPTSQSDSGRSDTAESKPKRQSHGQSQGRYQGLAQGQGQGQGWSCPAWLCKLAREIDVRLVLETAWFVVVNAGTMYMFLFRGFYWRGEDGELLDGGRVQRFMW